MANKESVEDLLVKFFGTELTSSPSTNIINISEDWITSSNKNIEVLIDNIAAAPVAVTKVVTKAVPKAKNEPQEEIKVKPSSKIQNVNEDEFEQLFRMKRSTVMDLQNELNSKTSLDLEIDTNLLVSLWILGNTKPLTEIANLLETRLEKVIEICEKYFSKILLLSPKYIHWPKQTEFISIEKGFLTDYKFPGVIGVIGSLYIPVFVQEDDPEADKYFNQNLNDHTIVLQAVCDNNFFLRDLFVGYPGSSSIATIFKESSLYKILTDENNVIVKNKKHLLGGTEHPQMSTLLTPYVMKKRKVPSFNELKFNALHEAVMGTFEKSLRMIEQRFPRIISLDTTSPKFGTLAAGCICTLHNFSKIRNDDAVL